jgi:hypothetical protein
MFSKISNDLFEISFSKNRSKVEVPCPAVAGLMIEFLTVLDLSLSLKLLTDFITIPFRSFYQK